MYKKGKNEPVENEEFVFEDGKPVRNQEWLNKLCRAVCASLKKSAFWVCWFVFWRLKSLLHLLSCGLLGWMLVVMELLFYSVVYATILAPPLDWLFGWKPVEYEAFCGVSVFC